MECIVATFVYTSAQLKKSVSTLGEGLMFAKWSVLSLLFSNFTAIADVIDDIDNNFDHLTAFFSGYYTQFYTQFQRMCISSYRCPKDKSHGKAKPSVKFAYVHRNMHRKFMQKQCTLLKYINLKYHSSFTRGTPQFALMRI